MTQQVCRRMFHFNTKRRILWRVSTLPKNLRSFWRRVLACWLGKSVKYRQLSHRAATATCTTTHNGSQHRPIVSLPRKSSNDPSDLVSLKISLFGDRDIGKTSFLTKYAGEENREGHIAVTGMNQVDKTLCVDGARISYSIWEVSGDDSSLDQIPAACKDSVAMLFMFDLTSRCTLNSVIRWYQQARKYNPNAIPVLIGTKFDDFVQLPIDLQWTIASQARAYAKALNATLFFSSATYNINVNKVFKYVTAKLFNLPWNLERNLIIGEPMIDY